MNIKIPGVNYNQGIENSTTNGSLRAETAISGTESVQTSGVRLLQQLGIGSVFTGEITNINQNKISIALNADTTISATLSNALSFNIGDVASFTIKDKSDNQIILQANAGQNENLMHDQTINAALRNANVEINATTVDLVKNLMMHKLPIDSNTINNYIKMLNDVPAATPSEVVNLTRMSIPVTAENVQAFRDFSDFNNGISGRLNNLQAEIMNTVDNVMENNEKGAIQLLKDFAECFSENGAAKENSIAETVGEKELRDFSMKLINLAESDYSAGENAEVNKFKGNTEPQKNVITEEFVTLKSDVQENAADKVSQNTGNAITDSSDKANIDSGKNNVQVKEKIVQLADQAAKGEITPKEFIKEFTSLASTIDFDGTKIRDVIKHPAMRKIVENFTRQEMLLNPEDFDKNTLKKIYAKIVNDSNAIASRFAGSTAANSLAEVANSIRNDALFMNEMNQFMAFVQIPVKLSGQNAHGDLYVYSNRKQKNKETGELTAFLHLDMEHLGPMDILVKLQNKSVSTDFKVENEKVLKFIEAHMDELTNALNKAGYNVKSEISLTEKPYDFVQNVVNEELEPTEIKRFSFDVRT